MSKSLKGPKLGLEILKFLNSLIDHKLTIEDFMTNKVTNF